MILKDLPLSERPREKLLREGANALSNAELLAIVLRTGSREESALDLAMKLLSGTDSGLSELSDMTLLELMKTPGIGLSKAAGILSAFELGRRSMGIAREVPVRISSPENVFQLVRGKLSHRKREAFMVLHLNTKNDVISEEIVSEGTLNSSLVHPREVFQAAIRNGACSILVCHNHPSGDVNPSEQDLDVTRRLSEVGKIVGIHLLDHVIIGKLESYSFKAHGLL